MSLDPSHREVDERALLHEATDASPGWARLDRPEFGLEIRPKTPEVVAVQVQIVEPYLHNRARADDPGPERGRGVFARPLSTILRQMQRAIR